MRLVVPAFCAQESNQNRCACAVLRSQDYEAQAATLLEAKAGDVRACQNGTSTTGTMRRSPGISVTNRKPYVILYLNQFQLRRQSFPQRFGL
jgi:hypothetical protein